MDDIAIDLFDLIDDSIPAEDIFGRPPVPPTDPGVLQGTFKVYTFGGKLFTFSSDRVWVIPVPEAV